MTRRELMKASLAAAPGAWLAQAGMGRPQPAPMSPAALRAAGLPIPGAQWHGDSSIGAMLRSGPATPGTPLALVEADLRTRPARLGRQFDMDNLEPRLREGRVPATPTPAERLRETFPHLRRHFVFEYYAWYRTAGWIHWAEAGHTPPVSIAASMMPALGPYDSGTAQVIEQHARWMADAGVGAIALSWWGQGSSDDRLTPLIMDIMRAHDIHVSFHLEPYLPQRAHSYASDVLYLLREYGEKRRWDNFLLLENADGTSAPVFKSFRTILPRTVVDCTGAVVLVPDYTDDSVWRRQTDLIREAVRPTFSRITLLADSLDAGRTVDCGFDGIAIYDSYVRPPVWAAAATTMAARALVSSFSLNCGFDGYIPVVPRGVCDIPLPFEPPIGDVDWASDQARLRAEAASKQRIVDSLAETMRVQATPGAYNASRGFFLTYVNTFNEWHEGTSFEPAKHRAALSPAERARGYHNPANGAWRLETLQQLLRPVTTGR